MEYDVYSLIRSEEVREHARNHWHLSAQDKIFLIHFSYRPILERQKILEEFASSIQDPEDKRFAEEFIRIYQLVTDHIFHLRLQEYGWKEEQEV